ncbi:hypothetical protein LUW77_02285 [Streptomyces radiopugnans]|nr:hypothetical protein LUW77_02285 [Streptomyces radiopugnans]
MTAWRRRSATWPPPTSCWPRSRRTRRSSPTGTTPSHNHLCRARCLARAERFEEALAEADRADSRLAEGGPDGEAGRAETARLAALVEGNGLDRPKDAVARLDAAAKPLRRGGPGGGGQDPHRPARGHGLPLSSARPGRHAAPAGRSTFRPRGRAYPRGHAFSGP